MKNIGLLLCLLFLIVFVKAEDAQVMNDSLNANSTSEHSSPKEHLDDSLNDALNKSLFTDADTNSSDYYNDEAMNPEGGYEEINSNYTAHQEEGNYLLI